ncbi:VOC family protein [Kaistia dalseonensis]|nr:VOC family protein [Kaistia dalseonensis]
MMLHHVSIVATDLDRSVAFYQTLFELERLPRPPFAIPGAWLGCGDLQIHIVHNAAGTYRSNAAIDVNDGHFAFRTDDFEKVVERLAANGYREDAAESDPKRVFVNRHGKAGFPQLYLLDPDRNIVEVNGAPVTWP